MKKIFSYSLLLFSLFLFNSCNFDSSNISDVSMCTSLDNGQCQSDQPNFNPNASIIYISCMLNNAPNDTKIKFAWYYLGQDRIAIDAVTVNSGDKIGSLKMNSSLNRPNKGWPSGEYEVVISILGTEKEPIIKKFSIG